MNRKTITRLALLGLVAVTLAGCGGGGSTKTPTASAPRLEDTFGTQFGADYRASPNSAPAKPAAGDIVALSLTTQPTPLH